MQQHTPLRSWHTVPENKVTWLVLVPSATLLGNVQGVRPTGGDVELSCSSARLVAHVKGRPPTLLVRTGHHPTCLFNSLDGRTIASIDSKSQQAQRVAEVHRHGQHGDGVKQGKCRLLIRRSVEHWHDASNETEATRHSHVSGTAEAVVRVPVHGEASLTLSTPHARFLVIINEILTILRVQLGQFSEEVIPSVKKLHKSVVGGAHRLIGRSLTKCFPHFPVPAKCNSSSLLKVSKHSLSGLLACLAD
mmetsp:Transcript_7039/g.22538  ORF Transcript_7039/g.22538 Transcript_7039/m.22538 type:complete len:248 (-) Transcript_7039:549-1292(-)